MRDKYGCLPCKQILCVDVCTCAVRQRGGLNNLKKSSGDMKTRFKADYDGSDYSIGIMGRVSVCLKV